MPTKTYTYLLRKRFKIFKTIKTRKYLWKTRLFFGISRRFFIKIKSQKTASGGKDYENTNMKRILFIRHSESIANAGQKTSDPALIEITDLGKKQAIDIANAIEYPPELIITSPYLRTKQTAFPTINKYPNAKHEEWLVHEFTYLSPLKCKDTTAEDRKNFVHEYWLKNDPFLIDGEGAESFANLIDRSRATIEKLIQIKYDRIAVFSHGQFIGAMIWILKTGGKVSSEGMKDFKDFINSFEIPNASMIQIDINQQNKYVVCGL